MAELHQKKMKLEGLVNDFQDNNEEYLKVIKTVGEEGEGANSKENALTVCNDIIAMKRRFNTLNYSVMPFNYRHSI